MLVVSSHVSNTKKDIQNLTLAENAEKQSTRSSQVFSQQSKTVSAREYTPGTSRVD